MQRLDYLSRRLVHPGERIRAQAGELRHLAIRFTAAWRRGLEDADARARELALRLTAGAPDVTGLVRETAGLAHRLREGARHGLEAAATLLRRLDASLNHLNPQSVLERGYSITESTNGIVRDGSKLEVGDDVTITFARGRVGAQVKRKG